MAAIDRRLARRARPGVHALLRAAGCRVVPLGLARQEAAVPDAEGLDLEPGRAVDGAPLVRARRARPGLVARVAPEAGVAVPRRLRGGQVDVPRDVPARLVPAVAVAEPAACAEVRVLARACGGRPPADDGVDERAEATDGDLERVEPEVAHRRRVLGVGVAARDAVVAAAEAASGDRGARATARVARRSAVVARARGATGAACGQPARAARARRGGRRAGRGNAPVARGVARLHAVARAAHAAGRTLPLTGAARAHLVDAGRRRPPLAAGVAGLDLVAGALRGSGGAAALCVRVRASAVGDIRAGVARLGGVLTGCVLGRVRRAPAAARARGIAPAAAACEPSEQQPNGPRAQRHGEWPFPMWHAEQPRRRRTLSTWPAGRQGGRLGPRLYRRAAGLGKMGAMNSLRFKMCGCP